MRGAIAVAMVLAGAALSAQQTPEPVAIDVIVEDARARPPLTAAEFLVTEAGQPVPVEAARFVRPAADPTPLSPVASDDDERAAAPQADRLIAVYLDEYHLADDTAFTASRAALAAFIRSSLGPRDLVVIARPLDPLSSLRLTTDRDAAARLVETAQPRQGDYTPRSSFEQNFIAGAPSRIDIARNQIAIAAVHALVQHLGRFSAGRKTLFVFSNGIAAAAPTRGDSPLPGPDSIARAANRGRVAIYALRPTPAPAVSAPQPGDVLVREPLNALAAQTTGRVLDGSAIESGLQDALRDASGYYVLILAPPSPTPDGRLRSVSVTSSRPGVTVRARAAYSLPRPEASSRPARASGVPEMLKVPRHTSPLIRTWFGQAAGDQGSTAIAFVWEPAPRVPGVRDVSVAPARVAMTVSRPDGTPVFAGASGPSGREGSVVATASPQLTFTAPPGPVVVQMEVLDLSGRVLDRDVRDLAVAAFDSRLGVGTAAVFRSRSEREFRAMSGESANVAPVASRQFSRAEHLIVRLPVHAADDAPVISAVLQSRFGSALRALAVEPVPGAKGFFQVDLRLAPLASGGYAVEFLARSATRSVIERVEFTVTP